MNDIFGNEIKLTKNDRQLAVVLVIALLIMVLAVLFLSSGSTQQSGSSAENMCNNISPQQQINCLTSLAVSTQNATVCDALPLYQKDACLYQVAGAEQNITVCTGISRIDQQYSQCVEILAQNTTNPTYCSYLPSVAASKCIYSALSATNFKDISVCNQMNNATDGESCMSLYYFENAVRTNNATYCSHLQSTANFTSLYSIINNYSTSGTQGALGIAFLNVSPRDYCYTKLAQTQKNSSLCGLTTTSYGNSLCTYSSSPTQTSNVVNFNVNYNATNVTSACGTAPNIYYKNFCVYSYITNVAIKSKTPSICLQMNVTLGQYACITQAALLSNQPGACKLIANSSTSALCYNETTIYNAYNTTQ